MFFEDLSDMLDKLCLEESSSDSHSLKYFANTDNKIPQEKISHNFRRLMF